VSYQEAAAFFAAAFAAEVGPRRFEGNFLPRISVGGISMVSVVVVVVVVVQW
jgi:hypothetical protein